MKSIKSPILQFLLVAALLLILVFINYGSVLEHEFMLDDSIFLQNDIDELYDSFWDYFSLSKTPHYYPIYYIVNIFLFNRFADNPYLLHLVNIVLFYCTAILLYYLLHLLTKNSAVSFLTVFLFTLHPINAFTVNYITCNTIFICAIFLELSLILYWHYRHSKGQYRLLVGSIMAFILALLSFEGAFLLPFYILLIAYYIQGETFRKSIFTCLPFVLVATLYLLLWMIMTNSEADLIQKFHQLQLTPGSYAATSLVLSCWYTLNLIMPNDIVFMRNILPLEGAIWFWNILLLNFLVLAAIFIFKIYKRNLKSFALLWFLSGFSLVAVACINHADMGLVIEPHWLYFSSVGFFLFISMGLSQLSQKLPKKFWALMIIAVSLYYGLTTHTYNYLARTEKGYSAYWLSASPGNIIAALSLGKIYFREGNYQAALVYHLYVADKYSKVETRSRIYHNIGVIYERLRNYPSAKKYYYGALRIKPDYIPPYLALAQLYIKNDDSFRAQQLLRKAIAIDPENEYSVELFNEIQAKQEHEGS